MKFYAQKVDFNTYKYENIQLDWEWNMIHKLEPDNLNGTPLFRMEYYDGEIEKVIYILANSIEVK